MRRRTTAVGLVGVAVGVVVGAVGAGVLRPVETSAPESTTAESASAVEPNPAQGEVAHGDWSHVTRRSDDGTAYSLALTQADDIRIEVSCHVEGGGSYNMMLFLRDGLFDDGLVAAHWSVGEPEIYRFRDLNDTYLSGRGRPLWSGDPAHVEGLDAFVLGLRVHSSLELRFYKYPDTRVAAPISLLGAPAAIEALGC